jgi:hypothetical protein
VAAEPMAGRQGGNQGGSSSTVSVAGAGSRIGPRTNPTSTRSPSSDSTCIAGFISWSRTSTPGKRLRNPRTISGRPVMTMAGTYPIRATRARPGRHASPPLRRGPHARAPLWPHRKRPPRPGSMPHDDDCGRIASAPSRPPRRGSDGSAPAGRCAGERRRGRNGALRRRRRSGGRGVAQ